MTTAKKTAPAKTAEKTSTTSDTKAATPGKGKASARDWGAAHQALSDRRDVAVSKRDMATVATCNELAERGNQGENSQELYEAMLGDSKG